MNQLAPFLCLFGLTGLTLLASEKLSPVSKGWEAPADLVERLSERRPGINYVEAEVPDYELPDPLVTTNGRPVTTAEEWTETRRPEILELFRQHMYGRSPGPPERLSFTIVEEDPNAMSGIATRKLVQINCGQGEKELSIELLVFLPDNPRPGGVPLFLLINHRAKSNTDPTREVKSGFWPAEEVIEHGYGIAAFHVSDVDPDNDDGYENGVHRLFRAEGESHQADDWGTLAAWGWGASRAMDYFQTESQIDHTRIAVVGHSRGGKASLWAGVEDERFALVISNDSGCGGAALSRRRFGETVARINHSFPHWFCGNFTRYNNDEGALPFDQHMLISLIAPRAVYVASAGEDLWADPKGEFLSLVHAGPAYDLWGYCGFKEEDLPPVNEPLWRGLMGYHLREGEHNLTPYDWEQFMRYADRLWP